MINQATAKLIGQMVDYTDDKGDVWPAMIIAPRFWAKLTSPPEVTLQVFPKLLVKYSVKYSTHENDSWNFR